MDIFINLVTYKRSNKNYWSIPNFGTKKGYIKGITRSCIMLPRLLFIFPEISGKISANIKFPES